MYHGQDPDAVSPPIQCLLAFVPAGSTGLGAADIYVVL